MKYFGIGLSKTGTTSLQHAFEVLGFKAKHYLQEHEYRDKMHQWDFFNDLPVPMRYKELDERFPGSKFIYTDRNVDEWLDSCEVHWREKGHIVGMNWPEYRMELFGQLEFDPDVFRSVYEHHKKDVLKYFTGRNDFLIMNICKGDGWERLCPFIGTNTPNKPFPYANKRKHFSQRV